MCHLRIRRRTSLVRYTRNILSSRLFSLDRTSHRFLSQLGFYVDGNWICGDSRLSIEDQVCRATSWPGVNRKMSFVMRHLCLKISSFKT